MDEEDCLMESSVKVPASKNPKQVTGRLPFSPVGKDAKKKRKLSNSDQSSKSAKVLRSERSKNQSSPKLRKQKLQKVELETSSEEHLPEEKENIDNKNVESKDTEEVEEIEIEDDETEKVQEPISRKKIKSKRKNNFKSDNSSDQTNLSTNRPNKRKRNSKQLPSTGNVPKTPEANPIFKMFKKIEEKKENAKSISSENDEIFIIEEPEIENSKKLVRSNKSGLRHDSTTDKDTNNRLSTSSNISSITPTSSKKKNVGFTTPKTPAIDSHDKTPATDLKDEDSKSSEALTKTPTRKRSMTPKQILKESGKKKGQEERENIRFEKEKQKGQKMGKKCSNEKKQNTKQDIPIVQLEEVDKQESSIEKPLPTSSEPAASSKKKEQDHENSCDTESIIPVNEDEVKVVESVSEAHQEASSSTISKSSKSGDKTNLSAERPNKRKRNSKQLFLPENASKTADANPIFKMFKKIEKKVNKETGECDNLSSNDDPGVMDKPDSDSEEKAEDSECSLLDMSKVSSVSEDSFIDKTTNSILSTTDSNSPTNNALTPISSKKKKTIFTTPKTPANDASIVKTTAANLKESGNKSCSPTNNALTPISSKKKKTIFTTPKTLANDASIEKTAPLNLNEADNKSSVSLAKTPTRKRSMTPQQILRESEKKKKHEEREQSRLEKELQKLEKEMERKQKEEERQRAKEERQKVKQEELEVKRLKKEDEKLKREEERIKKEEEKQKKDEERQKKEEEKVKKEEEKKFLEVEAEEKKKKEKQKFAQFFFPKKTESPIISSKQVMTNLPGPFMKFQVKENMRMAPIVRETNFSDERKGQLDSFVKNETKKSTKNYLELLKDASYIIRKSYKTYPTQEKLIDENDCEILDEDEEDISGTNIIEENKVSTGKKIVKAKFLKFCENKRPAYYGTWSKMPVNVSGRNPFGKEKIFDYAYDSDEDWEEEETGESLSDSEGEGDAEDAVEENDQYEVDNDFFVPHGYLSDDEGKEDNEEEEEEAEETGFKDENIQKEQLKLKQAEFELEMKQKTKKLKPKVYGCVWMGDKSSHTAYDQLIKILSGHRAMVLFGTCPIVLSNKSNQDDTINMDEEEVDESGKFKFVKCFPEKAVPDLIRLIHGNPYSKRFLIREFSEFWIKKCQQESSETENCCKPIALRKIEPKIQELGTYGRFTENGISNKYRTWYVSKEVREKYGLSTLEITNSWNYAIPLKVKCREERYKLGDKDIRKSDEKEENNKAVSCAEEPTEPLKKSTAVNLITRFTKVLNDEEKEELLKKNLTPASVDDTADKISTNVQNIEVNNADESKLSRTPGSLLTVNAHASPGNNTKVKKRIPLTSLTKNSDSPKSTKPKNSIMSFLQKKDQEKESKLETSTLEKSSDKIITID